MSNLNKKILLFVMLVGVAFGLVGCSDPDKSVRIRFPESEYEIRLNETKVIEPTIIKSSQVGDVELVYSSSDESIVKVENGVLVPVAMGEATIKVEWVLDDIIFDKVTVKVIKAALPKPVLNYEAAMLKGASQVVSVSLGNNLTEATASFEALTPEVATITPEGTINAVAVGTAKFKLTVADYEESESVEFEVRVDESDFAIKYNLDGGQNHAENPVGYSALALPLEIKEATKAGYTFLGWYQGEEKVTAIAAGTLGDVELTAKWQINEYTIAVAGLEGAKFDDGYTLPTVYTVESEEIVLAAPEKAGYKFLGYYDGEEKVEKIAKGSTGNVELTAKWEIVNYEISYAGTEGVALFTTHEEIVAEFLKDFSAFAKEEVTAAEQYWANGAKTNFWKNAEMHAKWSWIFKFLSPLAKSQGQSTEYLDKMYAETVSVSGYATQNVAVFLLQANANIWNEQYKAVGGGLSSKWTTVDCTGVKFEDYAAYLPEQFPSLTTSYTVEEEVKLASIAKPGYSFLGWYNEADEKVEVIAKGSTGNVKLTAKWEIVEYSISYELDGGEWPAKIDTHALVVAEFLKDFSAFAKAEITAPEQYWANGSKTSFWKNAEMRAKWCWIFEFLSPLAKSQGESTEYLDKMYAEEYSVSGYATQNVAVFLLQANATIWNEQYKAVGGGLSSKWTTVDCTGVKYEDYAAYLPYHFGILTEKYTIKDEVTLLTPSKFDHIFLGWYLGEEKVESIPAGSTGDVKLTAKWKKIVRFPLTWDLAGGAWVEGQEGAKEFQEDYFAEVKLPTPVKKYHVFLGWYDGETKVESLTANQEYKLTAKWEDQRIDGGTQYILFVLDGGDWREGQVPGVDVTDYVEVLKLIPVKFGYKFAEWVVESDNETAPVTIIYTAKWEKVEIYTISYVLDGGENAEANPTQYTSESLPIVLEAAKKEGYEFVGWFDGETEVKEIPTGTTGNLTLTAKWQSSAIEVTLNGNGGVVPGSQASFTEIAEEFLADFNKYGEATLTKDTFFDNSTPGIKKALANAEMLAKWNWLFAYMKAHLIAINEGKLEDAYLADALKCLDELMAGGSTIIVGGADLGGPNARTMIRAYMAGAMNVTKGSASNPTFSAYCPDFSVVADQDALVAASPCKTVFALQAGAELPTPVREGYTFLGWYNEAGEAVTAAAVNLVATAKWELTSDGPFNITYDLAGGEFAEITYQNAITGDALSSFEIGKFYNDGGEYTEPVVITTIDFIAKNSLRWQKKILLVYREDLGAYEVVACDAATAGANGLGVEWTHALASTSVDVHTYATVGQLIVIEGEVAEGMAPTTAKVYNADQITSQPVKTPITAPATYSKAELPLVLPTPVKDGAEFAGWTLNGEAFDGTLTTKLGDITLVATWK